MSILTVFSINFLQHTFYTILHQDRINTLYSLFRSFAILQIPRKIYRKCYPFLNFTSLPKNLQEFLFAILETALEFLFRKE